MNFGEKLRLLRQHKNLTQPELADSLGIEQSYLSKLENGKSLPSSDVLNRVLDVFAIDISELVDDLDQGARYKMRQIPDVADHFNRQKAMIIGDRRRWLLSSALLAAVGSALIYAGSVNLILGNTVYSYSSPGVVQEGEPDNVFSLAFTGRLDRETAQSVGARADGAVLHLRSYRGHMFNVPVDGGSRRYELESQLQDSPWQNKAVATFGVLLLALGAIGVVLEKKLSRYQ